MKINKKSIFLIALLFWLIRPSQAFSQECFVSNRFLHVVNGNQVITSELLPEEAIELLRHVAVNASGHCFFLYRDEQVRLFKGSINLQGNIGLNRKEITDHFPEFRKKVKQYLTTETWRQFTILGGLSPDGNKVAVCLPKSLVLLDLENEVETFIPLEGIVENPEWSPDGKRVAFWLWQGAVNHLMWYDLETQKVEKAHWNALSAKKFSNEKFWAVGPFWANNECLVGGTRLDEAKMLFQVHHYNLITMEATPITFGNGQEKIEIGIISPMYPSRNKFIGSTISGDNRYEIVFNNNDFTENKVDIGSDPFNISPSGNFYAQSIPPSFKTEIRKYSNKELIHTGPEENGGGFPPRWLRADSP